MSKNKVKSQNLSSKTSLTKPDNNINPINAINTINVLPNTTKKKTGIPPKKTLDELKDELELLLLTREKLKLENRLEYINAKLRGEDREEPDITEEQIKTNKRIVATRKNIHMRELMHAAEVGKQLMKSADEKR